jgi:divalent metal cation (Fe/Co/Zn/Cd) transporter
VFAGAEGKRIVVCRFGAATPGAFEHRPERHWVRSAVVSHGASVSISPADRDGRSGRLLQRGRILEGVTLGWNVIGVVVLCIAAVAARSVALAGFGLDSLIEIGASAVVLWELSGTGLERQGRALRLIGGSFAILACYLAIQSTLVLVAHYHPRHSPLGIAWTALTALAMFALAVGKDRTGRQLNNPVLRSEGRVTLVDGLLASAVLAGLALNAVVGWWWADPLAGYVLLIYGAKEGWTAFHSRSASIS